MSKIELYRITPKVKELQTRQADLEKRLQTLIEQNMETFFGVRFLSTEYTTSNGGRIDSLGLDENNLPVIFEYKRSINENVINQGLFYLDWLDDHKADFRELVRRKLGDEVVKQIDNSAPRVICIASDFTKYDIHAVKQIDKNIDLIKYQLFDNELLLFELAYSNVSMQKKISRKSLENNSEKKQDEKVKSIINTELPALQDEIIEYIKTLGDDVTMQERKLYLAFKKIKNFVCLEQRSRSIILYLKLNPDEYPLEEGFTRDVRNKGHWGTGNLEVVITDRSSFEKAKSLILESYQRG